MSDYLRINHDIGCKTVWSEVLWCIKEDPHGSFCKEFHGSDIFYMCTALFLLLECDPHVVIFGAKYTQLHL